MVHPLCILNSLNCSLLVPLMKTENIRGWQGWWGKNWVQFGGCWVWGVHGSSTCRCPLSNWLSWNLGGRSPSGLPVNLLSETNSLVFGICQFPWCKYVYHGWFQVIHGLKACKLLKYLMINPCEYIQASYSIPPEFESRGRDFGVKDGRQNPESA